LDTRTLRCCPSPPSTPLTQDESLPFKLSARLARQNVDGAAYGAAAAADDLASPELLPLWMPSAPLLHRRAKNLLPALKKALAFAARKAAEQQDTATAAATPAAAAAAAASPGTGLVATPAALHVMAALQQQQQLAGAGLVALHSPRQQYGVSPVALQQALQVAAAAGNSNLVAQVLLQRQQLQMQQIQSVLGKRTANAAGLADGGSSRRAPGEQSQQAGAAAAAGGPGPSATVAAAGAGGLSESQAAVLRSLPPVKRDASGRPIMPIVLSKDLMVVALGR
jgi:hypothetical protein